MEKFAAGSWTHLFGVGSRETECRVAIDCEKGELLVAMERVGAMDFQEIRGARFRDLAESVIHANEAHKDPEEHGLERSSELPAWAAAILVERDQVSGNVSNSIEQPINATIQAAVLTLPNGQSIDLTRVQAALNFGFQETGDHDLMAACDEISKLTGLVQGPSGEFVPAGDQEHAAMPRTAPDLSGFDAYALQRELERRGLLVQLWSPEDFEFIGNEGEEAADLSGDTLEQIQQQAFEQCRRSLDEITTQRGNEHLGDWWAMNKEPILEQFKPNDEYPRPGM